MVSFGGGGGGTAGYLTGEKDSEGRERESVEVLIGDPSEVQAVADSLEFAHQSTTGVIAWAPEDHPTEGQIREVLQEFEKTAWAGLEPDRYAWSAVQHRDAKGGVHVHVFAARVDLETGKSLNIAPPGWEKTFGALRDWQNFKHGWSRPDDPARARVLQQDFRAYREASERRGGRGRPEDPRKTLTAYVVARIESGSVTDRGSLVAALKEAGLEVPRQGKNYITVRDPNSDARWRLKGSIYGKDWKHERTGTEAPGQGRGGPEASREDFSRRAEDARRELEALRQQRAEFHRARYGVAHPAPGRGPAADHSRGSVPRSEPLSRHLRRELGPGAVAVEPGREPQRGAVPAGNGDRRPTPHPRTAQGQDLGSPVGGGQRRPPRGPAPGRAGESQVDLRRTASRSAVEKVKAQMTELERQLMDALTGLAEQYERDQTQIAGQVADLQKRIETRMKALTGSMNSLTRLVRQHETQAEQLQRQVKLLGDKYDALAAQLRRL